MITTRESRVDDEAWIIEKINQIGYESIDFSPRSFVLTVDSESEERFAFARRQYIRSKLDEKEFVEVNNFVLLDSSEEHKGCILLRDIVENMSDDKEQVFAFPHENIDVFKRVGFDNTSEDNLPPAIQDRYNMFQENFGDAVEPLVARPSDIEYVAEDDSDEIQKTTGKEMEKLKQEMELDKDDVTTKYST